MPYPQTGISRGRHLGGSAGLNRVSRRLVCCLIWLLSLLLAGCESLTGYLFFPMTNYVGYPDQLGLAWEPVTLRTADGEVLHSWWLPPELAVDAEPKGHILYLHGNGENISTHIHAVGWLPRKGYGVLLLGYRGYGQSSGHPRLPQVFEDIRRAHEWLTEQEPAPLILLGQSLGGSLGLYYLGNADPRLRRFDAAVIESAPASLPQAAAEAMSGHPVTWLLQWPAWMISDAYDPQRIDADKLPAKLMLLHGEQDAIVAPHHLDELEASFGERVVTERYAGGHIQAFRYARLRQAVLNFLEPLNGLH